MGALRALFPPFVGGRMGVGLLILRIVVGVGIMSHGWGKIQNPTGWMGPSSQTSGAMQALAATGEFFGGLGIVVGALTPIAAAGVAATMIGAILIGHSSDPWLAFPWLALEKGAKTWEMAGLYLAAGLALMLLGPGRFSIDALLFGRGSERGARDEVILPGERVRT